MDDSAAMAVVVFVRSPGELGNFRTMRSSDRAYVSAAGDEDVIAASTNIKALSRL